MNQHLSLSPRRNLLASQVARGFTQDKISPISQKVSPMRVTQMILAATFALALPEQSLSQEISDDRIKALVAETLRENPELVLEDFPPQYFLALPLGANKAGGSVAYPPAFSAETEADSLN